MSQLTPDWPRTGPIVAPSILSADFSKLPEALGLPDPTRDWVHCDVMDNHFVPNLTFGPIVIQAARALTSAFLDVHLMIEAPLRVIPDFRAAGADGITVHVEACEDVGAALRAIRASGARVGLSLKPGTPFAAVEPYLGDLDLFLVMTVEPGFGGQSFMADQLAKVREAVAWRERHGAGYLVEVDGGIGPETAREARDAGADVFVAGHAVYRHRDPGVGLGVLRGIVRQA